MKNNVRVMWPLLVRDAYVLGPGLWDDCINSLLILAFAYINFSVFGARFGIDHQFAAQAVIGIIVTICVSLGFGRAFTDLFDRDQTGFMTYRRTLMISTRWLLTTFVMSYAVHIALVSIPAVLSAWYLFSDTFSLTVFHLARFIVVWLGGVVFFAIFNVAFVCLATFQWFRLNVWQRVLTPISLTGCVLYSWGRLHAFSPLLGRWALCNPLTYFAEGMRVSLNGSEGTLPWWVCAGMIWVSCAVLMALVLTIGRRRFEHA